ncbi:DNA-processing protein DprA [Acidithiobacillus montserratensis]|uniref:DNA-processing protein DprA n=1 Tax=Acidithiobacillus montserratensis TaxID=2729135 RepID=A0ACD5HG42_9PROT|nr:DNA-processing protein DprA [Acidithiobacillus montserratensis]MBN2680299.1 DNA-processing protein DprA [Acidithiobacillaceae bacterium]MBU2747381.1 DNA-protecting protein DprA [Acidithiobacillus montserratensis]
MSDAAWLALCRISGLGPVRQQALLARFATAAACFQTGAGMLQDLGLSAKQIHALQKEPEELLTAADRRWLSSPDTDLCRWTDADYPPLLRQIPDPPPLLFIRGQRSCLVQPMLAIVGSRSASASGAITAEAFARSLGESGLCITSGLALGIDAAAHRGALTSGSVAVLGTGADLIYPRANLQLAHRLIEHGLIISEQAPETGPHSGLFPRRNRIISGLSLGVLIVEAAENSGSLITARLAMEQGREVFAVPGSIHSPLSRGPHRLIREGAKLVESAEDVLSELGPLYGALRQARPVTAPANWTPEDPRQARVWAAMDFDPLSAEEIAARCGLTLGELSAILLEMEISGYLTASPGGRFCRLPPVS